MSIFGTGWSKLSASGLWCADSGAFVPAETHDSFISCTPIIVLFIKPLVKKRKTLWFRGAISREASGGLIAARLGPSPSTALLGWMPVIICLIWYEEEWSEPSWLMLIWTDGWKDGWTPSPLPPPHRHHHQPPPHRRWRPAGTLLHGLQSANGWLADRKVEDCQIFDLMEGRHPNTAAVFGSKQQETRGNSASLQTNVASLFPRCTWSDDCPCSTFTQTHWNHVFETEKTSKKLRYLLMWRSHKASRLGNNK